MHFQEFLQLSTISKTFSFQWNSSSGKCHSRLFQRFLPGSHKVFFESCRISSRVSCKDSFKDFSRDYLRVYFKDFFRTPSAIPLRILHGILPKKITSRLPPGIFYRDPSENARKNSIRDSTRDFFRYSPRDLSLDICKNSCFSRSS